MAETERGEGGRKGRKRGAGGEWEWREEGGAHSTRENVKRRTSIKSARDDGLNVCGGEERLRGKREGGREGEQGLHFCMSASGYLHCGAQHAKRPAARKRKITQVMME